MRTIDSIFIHCSATPPEMDVGVTAIRRWHKERGWSDIGYHYVIKRDGTTQQGRPVSRMGAHTKGYNATSIGICLAGGVNAKGKPQANYTRAQWMMLEFLVDDLMGQYGIPHTNIHGHNEVSAKACPCFYVPAWLNSRESVLPERDKSDKEGF